MGLSLYVLSILFYFILFHFISFYFILFHWGLVLGMEVNYWVCYGLLKLRSDPIGCCRGLPALLVHILYFYLLPFILFLLYSYHNGGFLFGSMG